MASKQQSKDSLERELATMKACYEALKDFEFNERGRVLEWVEQCLDSMEEDPE